jgi:predicted metal-dependent HD superfamily phosphohydrolase
MEYLSPERYLSAAVRNHIEQLYYVRVNEQADFEKLIQNPLFWKNAAAHPALFSDHGVVHVRDVAKQILRVMQIINGVLLPSRTDQQMESFLYGYGVALAYLHDIGMRDLSLFGRAMHPEFAAQSVFDNSLDYVVTTMWDDNCGNIAWRLTQLSKAGFLQRDPQIIFRELLAMSIGHSKSKILVTVLDNPIALRKQMQMVICHNLRLIYSQQQIAKGKPLQDDFSFDEEPPEYLKRFYTNFELEAFDWLTNESEGARQLVSDVTDTLRALRCADAFRQRGTVEKTSGGYEIYASQKTGDCVIALRLGGDRLYLMELPNDPDRAGESNIASSEFNTEGNLRISFHRGAFENQEAQNRSAYSTAYVISDLLRDTVDSFWRAQPVHPLKASEEIQVLLESTDDDPHFAELVQKQLRQLNPKAADQIQIVPSLRNVSESERARYLVAKDLDWDSQQRQFILDKINHAGQKFSNFDPIDGFKHVKCIKVEAGEKLIEAGTPSAFVYFPMGEGLKIIPLGGYQSFSVAAWMPLGTTGVIRGDVRNADIIAEQSVSLLIIPKEVYMRYWYVPYSPLELRNLLTDEFGKNRNEISETMINPQFFEQARQYALQRLVRELHPNLIYHSVAHTRDDVVPTAELLAGMEDIRGDSLFLLLTSAWFHDLGFIEMQIGHEAVSARLASEVLPGFGYTAEQIRVIEGIIRATVFPQSPQTHLEQIMVDADLDVLGRDDFMSRNADLRGELSLFGQEFTDTQWFSEQLKFLENHTFFTASARTLRDAGKMKNIIKLKKELEEIKHSPNH